MQKKLLASCVAGAFAAFAGVASAGPISVGSVNTYAAEGLVNVPAGATVTVGNVVFELSNPIASGATGTFTYALDVGVSAATPAVPANCPTLGPVAGLTLAAPTISLDGTTCRFGFTATADVPSRTILSFTAGETDRVAALASAGAAVATVDVLDSAGSPVGGERNSAPVARAANALQITSATSTNYTSANVGQPNDELSRLNVLATPPLSGFTDGHANDATNSTSVINVGAVVVSQVAGTFLGRDAHPFTLGTLTNETLEVTVGGPFVNGAVVSVHSTAACTAPALGAAPAIAGGATSVRIDLPAGVVTPETDPGTAPNPFFVCYTAPGGTPARAMNAGQFTVAAEYDAQYLGTAIAPKVLATANVLNLMINGAQVDIRNYVPNAFAGWFSAYRIINTGAVAAAVSGQFIDQNGALLGTAQPISGVIPAGGVVVLGSAAIEGILGAASAPGGVGPRLRLTSTTDSLRVQSFACQPAGPCFLNSDAQEAEAGGATK